MSRRVTPTGSRRPEFRTLEQRLKWARDTAPLTQAELAAHLGISKRTVQNYESGVGHPSEDRLLLWANACDADYEFLAGDFYASHTAGATGAAPIRRMRSQSSPGCVRRTRVRQAHPAVNCDAVAA